MLPTAIVLEPTDGCLCVIRSLRRRGVEVHVLANPAEAWAAAGRGVQRTVLPPLRSEPQAWVDELEVLAGRHPSAVVIAGSDAASELLVGHRADLPAGLRSFERADGAHLQLMDKERCHALAAEAGIRIPATRAIATPADLEQAYAGVPLPAVVKPAMRHRVSGERIFTTPVRDRGELEAAVAAGLRGGQTLLLSEEIPGPDTNLEGAVVVRDDQGAWPLVYSRRKLRQWPLGFGVGTITESFAAPETIALAQRLLEHAGFVGLASVEVKRHAGTGELVLIEANVRVPQSFGVGDAAGIDASWRLYAALAGIALPPQPPPRVGAKAMVPLLEARAFAALVRRGESPLALARDWRGVRDVSVLDLRDPWPLLALLRSRTRRT